MKQVGGDHYQAEYQHWDWATDLNLPYLLGYGTKYLQRWRKKGGVEDLRKCLSALEKMKSFPRDHIVWRETTGMCFTDKETMTKTQEFQESNKLPPTEYAICVTCALAVIPEDLDTPIELVKAMINHAVKTDHPAPFGYDGEA